jgi:uncharacterized FlaG/YvyC family protein
VKFANSFSTQTNKAVQATNLKTQGGTLPVKAFSSEQPPVDLKKFADDLKSKFKQIENGPSFPKNLNVKLDIGLEFGVFVLPENFFVKFIDTKTNNTLKIQPPEQLLKHRVVIEKIIAEPSFEKVLERSKVNLRA